MSKIMLIEDELSLAEIVKESLEEKGFEVYHAATLANSSLLYKQKSPDILVIDVMLPDGNGFDWVSTIRKSDSKTPVIFLTSLSQTADVVKGFELGGNDYIKKPFSIAELIVRIQALLKREFSGVSVTKRESFSWSIGAFVFYYPAGELVYGAIIKQLTSREADLLQLLLLKKNESLSRNEILQALWGNTDYFSGRSLDVFISKLRRYLSEDTSVKIINVRSIGYKLIV